MLKVSETYLVGVDISGDDESVVSICRLNGGRLEYIQHLVGEEAEELYNKIKKENK